MAAEEGLSEDKDRNRLNERQIEAKAQLGVMKGRAASGS